MAIKIPILTSFDPKGLKVANSELNKLKSSVGSLGKNFAIAGAAVGAAFAAIGKSVADAAEAQKVLAQTEAVLKSTGTTANGTAKEIAGMASALQKSTAFNDEAILSGANLLLTFKNIQNQAGEGNDIFNQTTAVMLDVARAMGTDASGEAIRLGKALNDPVRGISALTRVGITFTEQQKEQIKTLTESGDILSAQKIILAELQSQFGGSAAAYAETFAGQVESLNNELADLSEEIGFMVMPAIKDMVAELRNLIPVIGAQLKDAIAQVDWSALTRAVLDLTKFFVEHGATIAKVVIGIFALNTAFKLMQVAIAATNVAIALKTWYLAQLATGMTASTIAAGAFSKALRLIPFVAVVAGIALVTTELLKSKETFEGYRAELEKSGDGLTDAGKAATAFSLTMLDIQKSISPVAGLLKDLTAFVLRLTGALKDIPTRVKVNVELETTSRNTALNNYLDFLGGRAGQAGGSMPSIVPPQTSIVGGGGSAPSATSPVRTGLQAIIADANKNAKVLTKQTVLAGKGLSAEVAQWITSSSTPVKAANEALARINKNGQKAVTNLTKAYNKSAAGQASAAQAAAEASAAAAQAAAEMRAAQEAAARAEAEALAERERVYNSFLDSVKNTFAGIKNAILGAFDLGQLGGSTNAITRNMDKLLVRLRSFATNVTKLSGMGLDPALLQQVIAAGPLAGARLAQTLVAGGANALASINAGYNEFGALSSQIAQTGTESLFNQGAQQNVYNINVDGGVGSGSTIGKAIVDAIKAYERTSGAVWQGA